MHDKLHMEEYSYIVGNDVIFFISQYVQFSTPAEKAAKITLN